MKRTVWLWQLMGFAVTSLLGTILHFLYNLTGGAAWVAPFSGVNESTFEHMKLLFWPMLAFALFQSIFFRDRRDFWCVKLRGISLGLALIPIIFYTYNGAVGKSPDWLNITIFFVCAAAAYIYEARLFKGERLPCKNLKLPLTLIFAIAITFVLFTFMPPKIGLFQDPLTGSYGI
jgi:hypothetical protein